MLVGSPGSAKTLFLTEIRNSFKSCIFAVASSTRLVGLIDQLFDKNPKYLLMDVFRKMSTVDQTALQHLMQTWIISETKIKKTRELKLKARVIATANSCERLISLLLSRFVIIDVPEYTFDEFQNISIGILANENIDKKLATVTTEKVCNQLNLRDICDLVKISSLSETEKALSFAIQMIKKRQLHT